MGGGRVAVVGSLNMDLVLRASRWPRLGETVAGEAFATHPGGKGANQAVAARRAGAAVMMVGRVGTDAFGRELRRRLRADGVDLRHLSADAELGTGIALIHTEPGGDNRIVVVPQANGAVSAEDVGAAREAIAGSDVLLLQGEVPPAASLRAAEIARGSGRMVCYNPAPAPAPGAEADALLSLASWVLPNETELAALTGARGAAAAAALCRRVGGGVLVTLGARGALMLASADGPARRLAPHRVEVVDTVGAGDAFAGAFAAALALGADPHEAARFATAAGALACTRAGALPSMPSRAEIRRLTGAERL